MFFVWYMQITKDMNQYGTPELNDKLYLHFKVFVVLLIAPHSNAVVVHIFQNERQNYRHTNCRGGPESMNASVRITVSKLYG